MNLQSYILLAVIAAALILAVISIIRNKGRCSCSGGCTGCCESCCGCSKVKNEAKNK